jgi:hypothetical protein
MVTRKETETETATDTETETRKKESRSITGFSCFDLSQNFATTGYYRLLYISSGGIADIFEKAKSFFPKSFSEAPIW